MKVAIVADRIQESVMKSLVAVASVILGGLVVSSMVGCASEVDPPQKDEDLTANRPRAGQEGGMCGGFGNIRCAAGLDCELSASHPDASGTCTKKPGPGEEGGMCGGLGGIRCAADLDCQSSGSHPDASGTCVKK
jgi:hypothetical protein